MRATVEAARDYGTYVMATAPAIMRAAKVGVKSFEHAYMMDEKAARAIQEMGSFVVPMPQFNKVNKGVPARRLSQNGMVVREREATSTELINKYNLKILFGTDLMVHDPAMEPQDSVDLSYYE